MTAARTLTDADLAALRELVREEIARNGPLVSGPSPWMTSEAVAEHLACSSRSVQNYARRGSLRPGCGGVIEVPTGTSEEDVQALEKLGAEVRRSCWVRIPTWSREERTA